MNPNVSRSELDRCLRRHGVGKLRAMKAEAPKPKHGASCEIRIQTIRRDNENELTNRLSGLRKRAVTGEIKFGKHCTALSIKHRLTPPKSPQANSIAKRFNGQIEEILKTTTSDQAKSRKPR